MSKERDLASAQAHIHKGRYRKAIADLESVLREDPRDVRAWLSVANLYHRQGNRPRAVDAFLQAAAHYEREQLTLKAIAVYKQAIRIAPERADLHLALARNYQQHGLRNEAAEAFQAALTRLDAAEDQMAKLDVIRQVLALDPHNLSDRVRLAEAYSALGQISAAAAEFRQVAGALDEAGHGTGFQQVAERLLYHQADDMVMAKRLAASYVSAGEPERALPKLRLALRAAPRDLELLGIVADALQSLGQVHKAATVMKEMARQYDKSGLHRERDHCYAEVLTLQPDDPDAGRALGLGPQTAPDLPETIELDHDLLPTSIDPVEHVDETETVARILAEGAEGAARDLAPTQAKATADGASHQSGLEALFDVSRTSSMAEEGSEPVELDALVLEDADELAAELQRLDFFLAQGLASQALALVEQLGRRYPNHPDVKSREEKVSRMS